MTEDTTEDWRHRAACRDANPEDFTPEIASPQQLQETVDTYCATCPVRLACWELARSQENSYGIHGGVWFGEDPRAPGASHCAWCGDPMDAERTTATYCGQVCRQRAYRARQASAA